ncbi:nuclear transport factor 2 family protein [Bacteroidota bacterium]
MKTIKSLLKLNDNIKQALMSCNTLMIKELYANEFENIGIYGEINNKDDILKYYKPGGVRLEKFETSDINAEVIGNIGIITGKGFIKGVFEEHKFEHKLKFTDIFIFRDSKWLYYRSHSTEIRFE